LEAEVDLGVCRERSIQLVGRFSGGGAVYHDLGNINYSMAIETNHPLLEGLDIINSYEFFSSGVNGGLKEFGIDSLLDPRSDLLVRNRKFSGNAQSRKRGVIFHHGTLLVNTDLDLLTRVLNAPKEGLKNRRVTSNKRPVTNLAKEVGRVLDTDEIKEALQRGFEKVFSVKLVRGSLSSEEIKGAKRLCNDKYSKKKWNFWRQT
jgi:lipoate-protein ligase A